MAWAPDYAEVAELAATLRIGDANDDVELGLAISAASRAIDRFCDRQFGKTDSTEARTFEAKPSRKHGLYLFEIDDLMTTTGLVVTVSGASVAASGYELRPVDNDKRGWPWTKLAVASATSPTLGSGPPTVTVTARWGWTAVPATIKAATLLQANRLAQRPKSPFGVAGSPDLGSELRLLERLDPDVGVHIKSYRRYGAYVG